MNQKPISQLLLDQSKDLFWIINLDFQLIYANKAYNSITKGLYGLENNLNKSIFVDGISEDDIEKWKIYYKRAFKAENFEIEEHYFNPKSNKTEYTQVTFEPLRGEDQKIFAVACQSKDITRIMQERSEANQLIDASLDVFCTINEQGNFVFVSAAAKTNWGYLPEELINKPYIDFILEEDLLKTSETAIAILSGQEVKSFINRYRKKNGDIAYNSWSVRWDRNAKLMYCVVRDAREIIEQKEKIQQREQRFKALVQEGSDLIAILDTENNFSYVSPTSTAILGSTPEEFIGKNPAEFVHPADIEDFLVSLKKIATENKVILKPFRFQNSKKEWRWIETVLTNMLNNSAVKGIVANSRDITDKIQQEEKIQKSEQRFKALVQEGSDLFAIIDTAGHYIYMSPSSISIIGIPPEEFIGKDAFEFIHPDDSKRTLTSLQKIVTEDRVVVERYRAKNHKNEWRWVETVLTNMLNNPAVKGIVVNSKDITAEVEEEHQLKLLESVITNTKDAVLITEAEPFNEPGPKIIYVNKAFTKMTGYTAAEVIGKTPRILQGPNSNRDELAKLSAALKKWEPHEITTINYKKNGEEFWVNFTVTPVANEKGGFTHWIAIQRDITEQKNKALEKELINTISNIFHQSTDNNLTTCLTDLCEHITKFGDFDLAEIWLPAIDAKSINRIAKYTKSKAGTDFLKTTKQIASCALGERLPGHVWKNKTTEIWENIEGKWRTKSSETAKKAGIDAIMGVPLKHKEEVIGVLLLGSEKTKLELGKYVELFRKLKLTIGSELSRKKTEIELAQIFDFTPDMICMAGFDGYIKRINPAGLKLLGYSLEEMCSRPITSFIYEEDKSRTSKIQANLYDGGNLGNFENRYVTKQGKIVWLSWTATSAPEHSIVYAVAKNITEEKNLRELNRQVGKLAKIGSWEVDLVNKSVFWSEGVHRLHETDPNTFVPNFEGAINFYRSDFHEMIQLNVENCISTGKSYCIEAVLVTTNKQEIWVRSTGNAEFIDGVCTRIYGSIQDIDDSKQAEIRLQSLAGNLPGVVFQYLIYSDGTDALKYVTKGSQQVWGFSAEAVNKNNQLVWDNVKAGGEFEEVRKSIADSIEFKTKWSSRYKYVMPSGELRTHLGSGTPTFLADGTILFNSIILDVTTEAKNEELLQQTAQIARIGSWEMDLINQDGEQMYWSPMVKKILELDESYNPTLTGGIEFHVGESKKRIKKALDLLIKDGTEFDEEILLRTGKGNERWNRAIGKSEMANNKRTKIYGSYQDIHDRKLASLALEKSLKSLEDYKFSLDQSAIIAFTDKKGVITSVNDNFCEISKYNRNELIGKTHKLINANHHSKAFFIDLWKTITSGGVWRGEVKNKAKDESYYWVDTTIVPFLDKKNKPIQYLAIRFDITERKIAEQERNSLQSTIENSLNEIYLFDAKTLQFSYVNKGALLNLGYSEYEIKALTPVDIKPDFTVAYFEQIVRPLISHEKGKIVFFTNHKRKNGSTYPVEVHLQLVREGNSEKFLAIILDITDRKKAEESILLANERFKKVTEATNDAIWDWDILNKTFYRSKAIERFLGKGAAKSFTEDDFWKDSFHLDDKDKIENSVDKAIADPSCNRWEQEYRLFNERGEIIYVIDRGVIIRNENGKATRMVGAMTDISKQKKSDEENKFKANLLSKIGQAAIATNLDGVVNYWNKAAENIYGWTPEQALGKNIMQLTPSETNEEQANQIMKVLQEGQSWSGEFNVRRKDGTNFPALITNSPIYDENNILSGMIGISSDITQEVKNRALLKRYTVKLERSNEELEQFAFVASHDLQEPLRMISSFMDQLKRKYSDQLDEKALQYIYFATDGAKRMKQIILDLLEYSRSNRPTDGKIVVDFNEILSDYKQLRRKIISEKKAIITSNELPTLHTHKAAITQIIHCLLDNSFKYSKEENAPTVEIDAIENEKEWKFSVKDNGIGIDPEFHDKIFIIFQRLHNNSEYDGTGIGLSIAKRHVEFLGGHIWLESKLGEGAVFYFTIPKFH